MSKWKLRLYMEWERAKNMQFTLWCFQPLSRHAALNMVRKLGMAYDS